MSYVQGYLVPVPTRNREAYLEQAQAAVAVFEEYGATRIVECWGDSLPEGNRRKPVMWNERGKNGPGPDVPRVAAREA